MFAGALPDDRCAVRAWEAAAQRFADGRWSPSRRVHGMSRSRLFLLWSLLAIMGAAHRRNRGDDGGGADFFD
ncbi:hypothetical protein GCM10010492_50590 [Saccharothrix mutabilis subsp. mutabilis]|uniref:Uncharacterized protein n=1 Tax=Saccharothrix mutabilis subsp. mutabilis TaxID=66855 RepID=A0ABN0UBI7_9PSEU